MKRDIIKIDEEKCNGCGICVPNCHEGALQIIDGKARLISDLMCDGLGACIGHCPEDAITIEKREAAPYDEIAVMKEMVSKGKNTVVAHLQHLKDHNEFGFMKQGVRFLDENAGSLDFSVDEVKNMVHNNIKPQNHLKKEEIPDGGCTGGCPGSIPIDFNIDLEKVVKTDTQEIEKPSIASPTELKQWPVQLHLLNPNANYFKNADVVLAADCAAFAMGNFHTEFIKGKTIAIACPKLDSNTESYVEKLTAMINNSKINTLTVTMMEVPCCGGLLQLAKMAFHKAERKIPIKKVIISIRGKVLNEEWV